MPSKEAGSKQVNAGQLADIKVLELASVLAGPSVGMFLAELGAEVVKVEHFGGGGDVTRTWKLPSEPAEDDRPAYFSAVNWGKRSIGVDLRLTAGQDLVQALASKADIVIASFKPGDAEKLQVDPARLMTKHPALIYADLTAYGPGDERLGFDAIIQAEAGFTYMNGEPESPPTKMPVALIDLLAAHQLKEGILLALLKRLQTGEGSHVTTSLLGAGLASLANQATNWLVGGKIPGRMGSSHPNIVPYGTIFKTSEGKELVLAVGNDGQFARLCDVLQRQDLPQQAEFATNAQRVRNRGLLEPQLREAIGKWSREALLAALQAHQVPAGAVNNLEEACAQPQAQAMMLEGGGRKAFRSIALEQLPKLELAPPPALANATESVLKDWLGMQPAEIAVLKTQKAIR